MALATHDAVGQYLDAIDTYNRRTEAPQWVRDLRAQGRARFAELGFPTTRDEEWKYTDVTPIAHLHEVTGAPTALNGVVADFNRNRLADAHQLVFVNGRFSRELSSANNLPDGAVIADFASAWEHPALREHLNRYATQTNDDAFTALNTAMIGDGIFIYAPAGVKIEKPIQILWQTTDSGAVALHPRALIIAGRGASITVVETFSGKEGIYFNNALIEVSVAENARVDHYRVERESASALHVSTLQVQAARDSVFRSHNIVLGGRLVRHNANAVMTGENIECTLNGLVLGREDQHIDNHTVMDHAMPHCNSHELYAHVLDGRSTAVFNGKIFVRRDAQKTDAVQRNRTLLLSNDATIDTKPQLEIFADDVKCTHGATIGQLDEGALFYLRARGIPEGKARDLLTYAFAEEVLNDIRIDALRENLGRELLAHLAHSRKLHAND